MPAIDRGLDRLTFLPEALRDALRRRLRELGGLALILVATLLALALATWSVQDPSLSHATNAPVRNVLGVSGAIVADLLIQLLGVAALALVLPIAIWGWRLATHRPLQRERIRLLFCVLAVLLATACTAALPRSPAWPLPVGLGGVIGDWTLRVPSLLAGGTLSGLTRAVVAIVAGAGTLVCFAIAAGLGWRKRTLSVRKPSPRPALLSPSERPRRAPWTTRPLMLYGRPRSAAAWVMSPAASAARTAELETRWPCTS